VAWRFRARFRRSPPSASLHTASNGELGREFLFCLHDSVLNVILGFNLDNYVLLRPNGLVPQEEEIGS